MATLFRFYAGSYRFHQEPPEKTTRTGIVIDLIGTALTFIGFYIAALLVKSGALFLLFVAVFHIFDIVWFVVGGVFTTHHPHVQKVIRNYLLYDLVTVLVAAGAAVGDVFLQFDEAYFQLISSALLFGMFAIDMLWHSRDWYFAPDNWRAAHACRH